MLKFEGIVSQADIVTGLASSEPDIPEMYKLILKVRQEAQKNFSNEPFENYLYGATVFSLRLLRIDDFEEDQYRRILAQLFSGVSRL